MDRKKIHRLNKVLFANALSCLVFGVVFIIRAEETALFVSNSLQNTWIVKILGALLLINALHLFSAIFRRPHRRVEILYFCIGDFLWVSGTVVLIAAGWIITTPQGIAAASVVAVMVGLFGFLQLKLLPKKRAL
ncbi:MAG: hypothetical protein EA357_00510 [Micavibrio sp.]|nr:MAG: hypothetical protein EA357_00510 [Micavibrio sp.]